MSLYRTLEQVTDHRQKRGVRYRLAVILSLVVLGKLAGMTSFAGIVEWVRLRADWLKEVLPLARAGVPCASTYDNVVRMIEAEELTRLLAEWLTRISATRRCGSEPSRLLLQAEARDQHVHLALDGKTLRGTLGHAAPDQQSCHLVALYEIQTSVVLAQQAVPDKGNEISLETMLLTPSHVNGRILTADSMPYPTRMLRRHHPLRGRVCLVRQGQSADPGRGLMTLFHGATSGCVRLAAGMHLYKRTWTQ